MLTADVLPERERRDLLEVLWQLEDLDDVGRLVDRLAI